MALVLAEDENATGSGLSVKDAQRMEQTVFTHWTRSERIEEKMLKPLIVVKCFIPTDWGIPRNHL